MGCGLDRGDRVDRRRSRPRRPDRPRRGWGYLFGDEGSGYAVALAGLRKVARQLDGRDPPGPSGLADRFCEFLGIESTADLVSAVYRDGFDRARLASMAPLVAASLEDDPSIVPEILEPAGRELALMVVAVARNLDLGRGTLPLAMAGGFLLNCEPLARVVLKEITVAGYVVAWSAVPFPVEGALALARREWNRP